MRRRVFSALCVTSMAAFAALALPAVASAFQNVTIEPGPGGTQTLHIVGDVQKAADLVTVTYDSVKDEYIITHDVVLVPPGCTTVGSGPPFKEVHCPQKGITSILIETGTANDTVRTTNIRLTTVLNFSNPNIALFFPQDLIHLDIKAGTGNDSVTDQPAPALAGGTLNPAVTSIDMGGGNDSASLPGGGTNTFVFADGSGRLSTGDGDNTVTFGNGNSNVTLGNGTNSLRMGTGNSKVYVGTGNNNAIIGNGSTNFSVGAARSSPRRRDASTLGTNTVKFGAGNSKFTGGDGTDTVKFGAGNNRFSGRGGNDKAKLGAGNDTAFGGPGNDKLIGGSGNDKLFGNAGFDVLKGGGGHADKCAAGGGGGKKVGCEKG